MSSTNAKGKLSIEVIELQINNQPNNNKINE
jgi:hypothetical protein